MSTQLTTLVPLAQRPLHERVAATVRAEMARYDVTQAQIAARLGVSQQAVSSKKSGKTPFTLDELEAIAPLFEMTADELVRGERVHRPVGPAGAGGWAPWGSNPQPADQTSDLVSGPNVVPMFPPAPAAPQAPERDAAPVIQLFGSAAV